MDVEPNPGNDPTTNTGTDLYYRSFSIDASLLDPSIGLHFDLYNLTVRSSGDIDVNVNAPFSHDAELTPKEPPVPPQEVPAPGTLLLLAAPLLGFGLRSVCRKRG